MSIPFKRSHDIENGALLYRSRGRLLEYPGETIQVLILSSRPFLICRDVSLAL